jgi:hypothetical protein
MQAEEEIIWICQYCGTHNLVTVDFTTGGKKDFEEDCRICCRPNRIIITIDREDNINIDCRICDE